MATPAKPTKKEAKKHISLKTSFTSPFSPTWRSIPQEDMHFILETLREKLAVIGLEKKEVKPFRQWKNKKKKLEESDAVTPEPVVQVQEAPKNGWTDLAARRQLAIGINEVTKALERNEISLVLVCKSVKPQHMTNHLITLCATRGVPACQVPRLSSSVSQPLGLKSVLAIGFRQCPSSGEGTFADVIDVIKPRVPPLNVAWLPGKDATEGVQGGDQEEMGDEEKRGQKRKLEAESEEATKSPSCSLQPLRVKRIIPNPAKKRKPKVKKK